MQCLVLTARRAQNASCRRSTSSERIVRKRAAGPQTRCLGVGASQAGGHGAERSRGTTTKINARKLSCGRQRRHRPSVVQIRIEAGTRVRLEDRARSEGHIRGSEIGFRVRFNIGVWDVRVPAACLCRAAGHLPVVRAGRRGGRRRRCLRIEEEQSHDGGSGGGGRERRRRQGSMGLARAKSAFDGSSHD
eukprot:3272814-Pleurochrysis_carterae.AAC.3